MESTEEKAAINDAVNLLEAGPESNTLRAKALRFPNYLGRSKGLCS